MRIVIKYCNSLRSLRWKKSRPWSSSSVASLPTSIKSHGRNSWVSFLFYLQVLLLWSSLWVIKINSLSELATTCITSIVEKCCLKTLWMFPQIKSSKPQKERFSSINLVLLNSTSSGMINHSLTLKVKGRIKIAPLMKNKSTTNLRKNFPIIKN